MSWFRKKTDITYAAGLFIPASVTQAPEPSHTPRPKTPLIALTGVAATAAVLFVSVPLTDRLSQPAAPMVVFTESSPYVNTVLTTGVEPRLADQTIFDQTVEALTASNESLIAIDMIEDVVSVYRNGLSILETKPTATAAEDSWRYVPAGLYAVRAVSAQVYSGLLHHYYPHHIAFGTSYAVHGLPTKVVGTPDQAPDLTLGVQLSNTDAATIADLVASGTPVVVRNQVVTTGVYEYTPKSPRLAVTSYIAADLSGAVLFEQASESVAPIASLTKLMTALVVAENYDLEGEVPVIQEAYVTTLVPRLPGTRQTSIYDLLQLLLLESSNEAAEVLASQVTREAFITKMNHKAAALGLRDTTFADPSGLSDENVSSVKDLLTLVRYIAREYPYLLTLTTGVDTSDNRRVADFANIDNYNEVDGLDGFIGGKIGETAAAGMTSATVHTMQFGDITREIVIVLLGSRSRDADVITIYTEIQNKYGE